MISRNKALISVLLRYERCPDFCNMDHAVFHRHQALLWEFSQQICSSAQNHGTISCGYCQAGNLVKKVPGLKTTSCFGSGQHWGQVWGCVFEERVSEWESAREREIWFSQLWIWTSGETREVSVPWREVDTWSTEAFLNLWSWSTEHTMQHVNTLLDNLASHTTSP